MMQALCAVSDLPVLIYTLYKPKQISLIGLIIQFYNSQVIIQNVDFKTWIFLEKYINTRHKSFKEYMCHLPPADLLRSILPKHNGTDTKMDEQTNGENDSASVSLL